MIENTGSGLGLKQLNVGEGVEARRRWAEGRFCWD